MIDREHLELHVEPDPIEKRRGCSVLSFLLLAVLLAIATPRSAVTDIPVVHLEETSGNLSRPSGAPPETAPRAVEKIVGSAIIALGSPNAGSPTRTGSSRGDSSVTETATPSPASHIGTALVGGVATWYDAPGLVASVPWWQPGQPTVLLRVCASECIVVRAVGFCACGDREGRPTVADLSRSAFARLAPLSQGVVAVTLEWPIAPLPATDE